MWEVIDPQLVSKAKGTEGAGRRDTREVTEAKPSEWRYYILGGILFMSFQSIHFIVHLSRTVKPLCSLHTMSCQQQRRKLVRSATMHIRLVSVVKYVATVWALSPSQIVPRYNRK